MRRNRNLREFRNQLLKNVNGPSDTRKQLNKRILSKVNSSKISNPKEFRQIQKIKKNKEIHYAVNKVISPLESDFIQPTFESFNNYSCQLKNINVCHYIDSLGLGGAQTMTLELINGLNKYYPDNIINHMVYIHKKPIFDKSLYNSYKCIPTILEKPNNFTEFCEANNIDIVVHHRTAGSKCIKHILPVKTKYILVNHTWNNLTAMKTFQQCDCYISVCNFLNKNTKWHPSVNKERQIVILNGVENDYINQLKATYQDDTFKTGRCHRLVGNKFRIDSLYWMINTVKKNIPNFRHYLIGNSAEAKKLCRTQEFLKYTGTILDRNTKMSAIKSLDVYFYETFGDEGASVAILESLACGIPVLCKKFGGCNELIINGINGFIVHDRDEYLKYMKQMHKDSSFLDNLKEKTISDFNSRLHVKHTACKYIQVFEQLLLK